MSIFNGDTYFLLFKFIGNKKCLEDFHSSPDAVIPLSSFSPSWSENKSEKASLPLSFSPSWSPLPLPRCRDAAAGFQTRLPQRSSSSSLAHLVINSLCWVKGRWDGRRRVEGKLSGSSPGAMADPTWIRRWLHALYKIIRKKKREKTQNIGKTP